MSWSIQKEDKYTLYTPEVTAENDLIHAFKLLEASAHKIIDARSISFTQSLKNLVSGVYETHAEEQKSFILVVKSKELMEELEELFIVVPTLSEAIDYLYMEELERSV
ncbi:MAG: hypothetical protein P8I82_01405 [Flavobacteriales bacterium]|nr:hypothetical protein [Flavobacteriales bacterium]